MVPAGCVFVAGIHPSRTRMSGSSESLRWNACAHRLDLSLYAYPKEFYGMESEPMSTPREKSPLRKKFSSEDRTHNTVSSRTACPTHYQWAIPLQAMRGNLDFYKQETSHSIQAMRRNLGAPTDSPTFPPFCCRLEAQKSAVGMAAGW